MDRKSHLTKMDGMTMVKRCKHSSILSPVAVEEIWRIGSEPEETRTIMATTLTRLKNIRADSGSDE